NLHYRVIVLAFDAAGRTLRMLPARAGHVAPPLRIVIERDSVIGADEHHCTGHQRGVRRTRRTGRQLHLEGFPIRFPLCSCYIAGRIDEAAKLRVVDVMTVHPEPADLHAMSRTLVRLRKLMVAAHEELAPGHPRHL